MNKLLLAASFLTLLTVSAKADVVIDGITYIDGCQKIEKEINGQYLWGIECEPITESAGHDQYYGENHTLPIAPGYPSSNATKDDSVYIESNKCRESRDKLSKTLYTVKIWLNNIAQGNSEDRVLTQKASSNAFILLDRFGKNAAVDAERAFRFASRNENGDIRCAEIANHASDELHRVQNLIKDEIKKGNRDLVNTGLNPDTSIFNK